MWTFIFGLVLGLSACITVEILISRRLILY